jgi:hypothetical protein
MSISKTRIGAVDSAREPERSSREPDRSSREHYVKWTVDRPCGSIFVAHARGQRNNNGTRARKARESMRHDDRSKIRTRYIGRLPLFVEARRRRVAPLLPLDLDATDIMEMIAIC